MQDPLPVALSPVPEWRWPAPAWRQLHAPAVVLGNRLCRPNSWRLDWFGMPAQVRVAGVQWLGDAATSLRHDMLVRVHWRGIAGYLGLDHVAAEAALVGHLGTVLWRGLPPSVALALLQDGADRLSVAPANASLGPLRFDAVVDAEELPSNLCAVQLRITPEDSGDLIALDWLVDPTAIGPDHLLAQRLRSGQKGHQEDLLLDWGGLPVPVAFELGWVRLPLSDLQGLRDGDVLLPDGWWAGPANDRVGLRVGANTGWDMGYRGAFDATRQQIKVTGWQKMERDLPEEVLGVLDLKADLSGASGPDDLVQNHAPLNADAPVAGALNPAAWGDMPVRMTFDLGERHLTLQELSSIGVGHVFDLGLSPHNGVNLRVNGLRVGEGEIVEIDGRLGVAVTRILPPRA